MSKEATNARSIPSVPLPQELKNTNNELHPSTHNQNTQNPTTATGKNVPAEPPTKSLGLYNTNADEDLLHRIQTALTYTQQCHTTKTNPRSTRRFLIPITSPSSQILSTLRRATQHGVAHLIFSTPQTECYELGVPPPPVPGGYPYFSSGSPQWWVGLSPAQIRAGPGASEREVKRAAGELKNKMKCVENAGRNKKS
ncbi:hypothetical protein BDW02DRAFT_264859 [Decorospora gaudefroyi]|uniref:Uncharacterized protein n=1 Tax=Decorospora gaudefroyi TaxID=184978 RepID=A0A6A5KKV4_9PLEO|nr:hypothetical protein BDW02DRAFT_264859 [Decorospora gaudefroyi]